MFASFAIQCRFLFLSFLCACCFFMLCFSSYAISKFCCCLQIFCRSKFCHCFHFSCFLLLSFFTYVVVSIAIVHFQHFLPSFPFVVSHFLLFMTIFSCNSIFSCYFVIVILTSSHHSYIVISIFLSFRMLLSFLLYRHF